jgi:hypothetical protein
VIRRYPENQPPFRSCRDQDSAAELVMDRLIVFRAPSILRTLLDIVDG